MDSVLQSLHNYASNLTHLPGVTIASIASIILIAVVLSIFFPLRNVSEDEGEPFGDWPHIEPSAREDGAGLSGWNNSADFLSSSVLHGKDI